MRQPAADQSGLAETSRSRDKGQFSWQTFIQLLYQARASDEALPARRLGAGKGDEELGLQQGLVHTGEDTTAKHEREGAIYFR